MSDSIIQIKNVNKWFRDSWGEKHRNANNEVGCKKREKDYDGWCQNKQVKSYSHFVNKPQIKKPDKKPLIKKQKTKPIRTIPKSIKTKKTYKIKKPIIKNQKTKPIRTIP